MRVWKRRITWAMFTIALVCFVIALFCPSLVHPAEVSNTANDNFLKVGQVVQQGFETKLKVLRDEIDAYVRQMSQDGVIKSNELVVLGQKLESFDTVQAMANNELKFYGLAASVVLNPAYWELIKTYRTNYFDDSTSQTIKKFFVEQAGRDIQVQSSSVYWYLALSVITSIFFMILLLVFLPLCWQENSVWP